MHNYLSMYNSIWQKFGKMSKARVAPVALDGIWPQGPKFTTITQYYYTNRILIHCFKHKFN